MPRFTQLIALDIQPLTPAVSQRKCSTDPRNHMEAVLCLRAFQVHHEKIQPRMHVHIQITPTDATVSTQNPKTLQTAPHIRGGPSVRKRNSFCAYFGGFAPKSDC